MTLPLLSFQLGMAMPGQVLRGSSLQLLLCLWDVALHPWLLSHQAASAQGHGSPPGRGDIPPLLPGLLQPTSKALAGKGLSASGSSCTSPGRRPRLRPLYQYINYDMPELMHPSAEEDEVPELAQTSQVPMAPGRPTAPQLEGELQQGLPSSCIPQGAGLVLPATCWSP